MWGWRKPLPFLAYVATNGEALSLNKSCDNGEKRTKSRNIQEVESSGLGNRLDKREEEALR